MKLIIILFILCGINFSSLASDLPHLTGISYSVTSGIGQGVLSETVEIIQDEDSHRYNITSKAQATGVTKIVKPGSIVRNSRGFVTEEGLQPSYFSDQRGKEEPNIAIFNWENNSLTLQHKGGKKHETLPAGTLDRLSLSYSFMFTPLFEEYIDVHITDGRTLELIRYKVQEEQLNTPIGKFNTIVLTKQYQDNDPVRRKIWLSPKHYMLPVRIVSTEKDGLELEKMVSEINISHARDKIPVPPFHLKPNNKLNKP